MAKKNDIAPDDDRTSGREDPSIPQIAEALLNSSADGVVIADEDGMIRECNLAAEQMFGYTREALLATRLEQLLPARYRKKHHGHRHDFGAHPTPRMMGERQDLYALRSDGQEFAIDIALIPLELGGERFVGAQVRDVTWRAEQEKELKTTLAEAQQLKAQIEEENAALYEALGTQRGYDEIVGQSPPLRYVLGQLDKVAPTNATVLITGETGTGKELLARAIHQHSMRQGTLFLPVNCASLPAGLVESELFGHEKGAFTGASSQRVGRFEQADGGTLFLDEIGDMPLDAQAKVLRVLQNGEFERVGSTKLRKTDVRMVAATNKDLDVAVQEGHFRRDLFHRLSTFPLHMPPLRERSDDIPLLTSFLVTRKAQQLGRTIEQISTEVMDQLIAYDWPGNVRELENVIERAIILTSGKKILPESIHLSNLPAAGGRSRNRSRRSAAGRRAPKPCEPMSAPTSCASVKVATGRSRAPKAPRRSWA